MGAHDNSFSLSIFSDPNGKRSSRASDCRMGIKFEVADKGVGDFIFFFKKLRLNIVLLKRHVQINTAGLSFVSVFGLVVFFLTDSNKASVYVPLWRNFVTR